MTNHYKDCPDCQGRGKITIAISKRSRRRYDRRMKQFEEGIQGAEKPKPLEIHIDKCATCDGCGLLTSENFSEVNTNYPHIAIIGGGIAGAALGVACLHRGIPYTIYERDESFDTRSQGYGLTLQQASKAIEGLGIFGLKQGLTSTRHVVHRTNGEIIGEWGVRKWLDTEILKTRKRRNVHISRQELRREMLDQLHSDDIIAWGHCLKSISQNSQAGIDLEFQVGDEIQQTQADLVVGADGIRSSVRSTLIGEEKSPLQYLGCIVILGICPLENLTDRESPLLDSATAFQTVNGFERIYMMPYDKDTIMWQFSFPIGEEEAKALSKKGPEALKKETIDRIGDWHSPVDEILRATETSKISGYPAYDRAILDPELLKDFGNITLMGDAMHPMSPFKGQGANQALLDALELARDITEKCGPDSNWREEGLRELLLEDFEQKMIERSALKVNDSATAAEVLHSDVVLREGNGPRGRGLY